LSSPPLVPLVLPAFGLIPRAPAAVRFFTPDGSFSEVVGGFEVTSDSLETVVPLFATGQDQLGSGTVSVEILQVINGRTVRSNAIEGFQIQDLPQSTLPAGSVVVAMLRAQAETFQASEGALGYMERLTKGRRGTSGARATMQKGAAAALQTAGALADI